MKLVWVAPLIGAAAAGYLHKTALDTPTTEPAPAT